MFREEHKVLDEPDTSIKNTYVLESTLVATHHSRGVKITGHRIDNVSRKWINVAQVIPWKYLLESHYTFQLNEKQRNDMKRVVLSMLHNAQIRSHTWVEEKWEVVYVGLIHLTKYPATFRVTQTEARAIMYGIADRADDVKYSGRDTAVWDALYVDMERFAPLPAKSLRNFTNEKGD